MTERQPILPEPCSNFCSVEQVVQAALDSYVAQPSLTVALEFPSGSRVHVRRDIEDRSDLIHDPRPTIDSLQERLQSQPCEFVKTGQCGAAAFLVESSLNIKLGR